MAIDTSIYSQIKPIDLPNPLDIAQKQAQLKSLSDLGRMRDLELQKAQRDASDSQAVRQAYIDNTTTAPDGTPQINKPGVLSALAKVNPQAAMQQQQQWQQQSLDQITKQHAIAKDILFSIHDQASQDAAIQQARALGLPPLEKQLPAQYDPKAVQGLRMASLSAEDQLTQANKDRDFQLKSQENQYKHEENDIKRQELSQNKQNQAVGNVTTQLESARGNPAAAQAERDIYASQKIKSLVNQYPDPNKMPPEMVKLLVSEVGKVAQGGAPTVGELEGLTPTTVNGKLAQVSEKLLNEPSPANAGAFLQQYAKYADNVAGDAKQLLKEKYGRIIESNRSRLNKDQYDTLNKQYINRFDEPDKQSSLAQPPHGQTVIQNGHTYTWNPQSGKYE